jgi:hypothetical protein
VVNWVRRKIGPDIVVWRMLGNGELGCSTPCVLCARELARFDLRVHCLVANGAQEDPSAWFSGRLTDAGAPTCKMTSRQKLQICRKEVKAAERAQARAERAQGRGKGGGSGSSSCSDSD